MTGVRQEGGHLQQLSFLDHELDFLKGVQNGPLRPLGSRLSAKAFQGSTMPMGISSI